MAYLMYLDFSFSKHNSYICTSECGACFVLNQIFDIQFITVEIADHDTAV